ncbi:phosphatidate cytidylyltransferase [Chitinophaga solisilvae]|uniref:Phosphatidate cytidylyltransferase n=1 Tax=Chitinophaga solisilvae TaxID=1233460 RepID=A0A3S1CT38_9BACT|nr:phosphatidate cytidylyltransferase [Chitinophaga solisilvae]NSL87130.1 phosphatidate cytidylyltransferase [Chitinophaga solisilvae]
MKPLTFFTLGMLVLMLSSCEVIGGIFKAGVWTGIIAVAVVLALIIWLISRGSRRG